MATKPKQQTQMSKRLKDHKPEEKKKSEAGMFTKKPWKDSSTAEKVFGVGLTAGVTALAVHQIRNF